MSNNNYLEKLINMSDEKRNALFDFIKKSLPDNLAEEMNQRFSEKEHDVPSKWIQIGCYHFLKYSDFFYAIETKKFGNSFISAVYQFNISVTDDMQDYIKLANESELEFPNDVFKLAYGIVRSKQYEEALAIKLSTHPADLYLWVRQWMLLEKDF